jgi:hypothetical protein
MHFSQQCGDFQRVQKIRLARGPRLALVHATREIDGALDLSPIQLRIAGKYSV